MCYDAKTSALAATIGIVSAFVAFNLKEWIIGSLILIYSLVQVSEFLIWRGLDTGSVDLNRQGTWIVSTTLRIHAIVVILVLLAVSWKRLESKPNRRLALIVLLGIAVWNWLKTTSTDPGSLTTTEPECTKGCRLNWKFGEGNLEWYGYWLQILIMGLAILIGAPRLIVPMAIFFGTALLLALSLAAVDPKSTFKTAIFTVWCFFAAVFAPLFVGYLWWKKKK